MFKVIRIFISLFLVIVGALFSEGYKDPLYLYWLLVVLILLSTLEYLLEIYSTKKQDLKEANYKITTLSILKEHNASPLQISMFPTDTIIANKDSKVDLFVASAVPINKVPEVKLITNMEWEVTLSTIKQPGKKFADKYEYILNNPIATFKDERYLRYSFYIKVKTPGKHELLIHVNNGEVNGEFKNILTVERPRG